MNINLLKALDWSLGRLVVRMLPRPKPIPFTQARSFLIIRPGGIGDAVLLIPSIISLKNAFPRSPIHVLAEKRNSEAFSLCSCIDRIYHYDRPGDLVRALRGTYDVVIDSEQWYRLSAVVARLTNAPVLIGFATNERKKMFTQAVPYSMNEYELHTFFDLLSSLKIAKPQTLMSRFVDVPSFTKDKAKEVLLPLSNRKVVVLFPGGSIGEKRWGTRKFQELAALLAARGAGVVVVGGANEAHDGEQIVSGLQNTLNLCGSLTIAETAAVLDHSSLLVTGDSGIMHIAYGLGVKTVALFGPGNQNKWAPPWRGCLIINKNLPCSPCTKFGDIPRCKNKVECMQSITVREVYDAAIQLLEG